MSQPNDNLKQLHKRMLADGYKLPDKVEDFARDMQDKGKRQRFYTNLTEDGYDLKDFDGFSRDILGDTPAPPAGMQIGVPVPLADNVHNRAKAKADEMLGRGATQLGKPQESPAGRPQTWTQAAGGAIGFPQLDAKTLRPVRKVNNPHKVNLKAKLTEADDRIYSTPVVEQDAPVPYRTDVDLSDPSSVTHPVYFTDPSTGMRYYPSNDGQYLAKDMRTGKVSVLSDYEAKQVDLAFERANFDTPDTSKASKVSSQVNTMADEVDQAIKERTEQLAKEHKDASQSSPWLTAIADVHNQRVGQYSVYGLDKDTEYNTLKAAQLALKESQGMIDEVAKNGASSFAGGALRGFTDKIAAPTTWDSGTSALNESMMTSIALTKADRGEQLSKGERLLLDAKAKQLATQVYFADGLGYGYKAGEVTAQAIPFMLEMVMGGGIKTAGDSVASGLARYAMRRFGAQIAKEGARKAVKAGIRFGSGAIGKSVAAAGMSSTFGAMRVAADTQRRTDGDIKYKDVADEKAGETTTVYGGHDDGDDFGTAFAKAFTAQSLEYGTEYAGDYIGKAASAAGKILGKAGSSSAAKLAGIAAGKGAAAPVAKALLAASALGSKGVAPVADLVRRIGSSNWTKGMQSLMREANWSGPVPEYLEEVLNNLGNAALVGDMEFSTEKGKGVFDPQLNLETFLGVGLMGGITSSIATGGYLANGGRRGMARDAMTRAAYAVESKMPAGEALERWRELRNEISMRSGSDQAASILSALDEGLFNEEQKAGILDFAKAVQQYRGLKEGKKIRQQEESSDPLQTQLEDSYDAGRKLASAEDMSKVRREYTQLKKHTALRLGVDPEALDDMGSADDISLEQIQTLRDRYSTSAVQSYVDYLNAKTSYEGMIAGVKSRISDAEVEVEARHRAIAHKNGTIQEAYVNNGSKEGRRVYVQDGVVVPFDGDTRVDTSKSDADIIVRDAETGKLEFVGSKDLISVVAPVGLDEAMSKELDEVKQQMAAIASAQIEGQLSFAPGEVYTLLNDQGTVEQVKVVEDLGDGSILIESEGKASKASKEELQQRKELADEQMWMEQRAEKEAEDKKEEQQERLNLGLARYQVGDELTLESPEGEELRAVVQAEENEDGKVEIMLEDSEGGVFVELVSKDRLDDLVVAQSLASESHQETSYNAVPEEHILETSAEGAQSQEPDPQPVSIEDESLSPEEAYDAIMSEVEGNEEIGASVLASMIEDKRAELKKIQSSKLRKASTISDKIAAEKERLQAIEAAQRSLEHWEAVAGERQRRALEEEHKAVEARVEEATEREQVDPQEQVEEEEKKIEERLNDAELIEKPHSAPEETSIESSAEDAHEDIHNGVVGSSEPSEVVSDPTELVEDEGSQIEEVSEEPEDPVESRETQAEPEEHALQTEEPDGKSSGQFGLVSDDRMKELKRRLREKLRGQANMGVDPEILSLGLELAVGYLDRGLHKFVDFAKALIEDLGDEARPYAKAFYNGARDMPEVSAAGIDALMDAYDTVKSYDIANFGKDERVGLMEQASTISKSEQAEELMKAVAEEAKTSTPVVTEEKQEEPESEERSEVEEVAPVIGEEAAEHSEPTDDTSDLATTSSEEPPVEYDSIPVDQVVGDKFTITKDFHDKNDTTIWVVRHTGGYVEYKVFSKWMNSARKFGNGRYTKYNDINGFIFETLQDARDFAVYAIEETYPKNASEEDKSLVSSSVGKSYYRAGRSSHYKVLAVDAKAGLLKAEVQKDGEQNASTIEYRIDRVADHIREGRWKEEDTPANQPINDSEEVNEEQSNGTEEEVHVPASPRTGEREGGHEPQQDFEVGAPAGDQDERSDAERVDRRSPADPVPDEAGGGRVPELPRDNEVEKKERAPKKAKKELKPNERNWSEKRGENLAPSNTSARIQANLEAIRLSKKIQEEGREATPEEMATLARWTGWGGLGSAFIQYSQSRKALEELLSPEEMEDAQQSRLSAYYTPAPIIDQLWDIVSALGFKGGAILEGSAGSGNILARMPKAISEASHIQAVELDDVTGTILSQLYPDADVHIQGFEKTRVSPGSVDLAITNVPFVTGLSVHDDTGHSDLSNRFKNIHDFCIAKNVRSLAPKGLGVFITSSGTMDKSLDLLKWLGQSSGGNVDVLGAFRLNNGTFVGASVTSDIIVVRKRESRDAAPLDGAIDISSVTTAKVVSNTELDKNGKWVDREYPLIYNSYFVAHPEMMGGEMKFAFDEGETYRASSTALYPSFSVNQEEELGKWVKSFKKVDLASRSTEDLGARLSYTEDLKGYKLGEIFVREDGSIAQIEAKSGSMSAAPLAVNDKKVKGYSKAEAVNDYRALKEAINSLISHQLNTEDAPNLKELQKDLNEAYDTFVDRYGHLNKNTAISFLKSDVDWPSVQAIEQYEERGDGKGNKVAHYAKADIFTERLVRKANQEKPSDPAMAVKSSILSRGYVDLEYLAEALGVDKEEAREAALSTGLAFEDPSTGDIESRYSYLSGNVRQKLKDAEAANADGKYSSNISALQEVLPQNIPAHLLPYSLGAKWMPANIFERYVEHKTGVKVALSNHEGVWIVEELSGQYGEPNRSSGVYSEELGDYIKGSEIMELALNLRTKVVSKSVTSGYGSAKTTERVTDKAATAAVADKADEFRMDFVDWMQDEIQADSQIAQQLTETYNRDMNNYAPMNMPDDFVPEHFEGASTLVKLRPHQAKAAIRATMQPVLLAHEVGTGKTYTMISAAMEMRRLGTARKPMVVVQNATLGQFVASAKKLYPQAKILALSEQDKNEEGRRRFYSQIMYNDWDMVIIPQSTFDRIPDSDQRRSALIQERIREKEESLAAMKRDPKASSSPMVRSLAKEIQSLNAELSGFQVVKVDEKRAAKTRANAKAKAERQIDRDVDETYDFDSLGVDALLVDEAHEYKRLGFETVMGRGVKGIDTASSKKAQGLYMKTKSVLDRTGGKNVVFATGTPISNTAAEIWTFMRYLMPKETMRAYGISNFDDFARAFGRIQTQLEFSTDGKFKPSKRFIGYDGLSELVRIWSQVSDTVLTSDSSELNDRIPKTEEGKAIDIFLPQSASLRSVMKYVKEELKAYDKMSGRQKRENAHIPLTMYSIAKAAAVDPRLVLDDATDDPNSKTNEAVRQALKSLEDSKDYKGTVAIFSDIFNNKATGFNLYEDVKAKLVKEGVPEDQIVIMRPMSDDAKAKLFDKVNRGEVRVILGSSSRLGTGVNIQERLHTLIHIDAPNRPMDYTQRNGRILRQGNLHRDMDKPVRILRFGVEDSLDVTAYQRLKTKGAIADSIMHGAEYMDNALEYRSIEEEGDNFGDMVATLSGSEYALLKNQAEKDLKKLESKLKQWQADQRYLEAAIPRDQQIIVSLKELQAKMNLGLKKIEEAFPDGRVSSIEVGSHKFSSVGEMKDFVKDYNKTISEAENEVKNNMMDVSADRDLTISVNGVEFHVHTSISKKIEQKGNSLQTTSKRKMTYSSKELGLVDVPVSRMLLANALSDIEERIATGEGLREQISSADELITRRERDLEQMKARAGKPFEHTAELEDAARRVSEYEALMAKELAAKEAKYAAMDAKVEAARPSALSEEEEGEEDNLRYGYTERMDGSLLSDNAMEAEANGRYPSAMFRKVYGVGIEDFKMFVNLGVIVNSEWHHTGKNYHETDYFAWRDDQSLGETLSWGEDSSIGNVNYAKDYGAEFDELDDYDPEEYTDAVLPEDGSLLQWYKDHKKEVKELAKKYKSVGEWKWEPEGRIPYGPWGSSDLELLDTRAKKVNYILFNHLWDEWKVEREVVYDLSPREEDHDIANLYAVKKASEYYKRDFPTDEQILEFMDYGRQIEEQMLEEYADEIGDHNKEIERRRSEYIAEVSRRRERRLSTLDGKEGVLLELSDLLGMDRDEAISTIYKASMRVQSGESKFKDGEGETEPWDNEELRGKMRGRAEALASTLGVPVRIVDSLDEIEGKNKRQTERMRSSRGWYNTTTGEVVIVLPNAEGVSDVEATVLHEVVGHKGLRQLVGDDQFNGFLDKVFRSADNDVRRSIVELSKRYRWDMREATEEYIAELAERGFDDRIDRNAWQIIRDALLDLLRRAKLALGVGIGDAELRYMLWRSYQMRKRQGTIAAAENVAMQQRMGVGAWKPSQEAQLESFVDGLLNEGDVRYRRGLTAPRAEGELQLKPWYDEHINGRVFQMKEALQDHAQSLHDMMMETMRLSGVEVGGIGDIDGFENAYLGLNRLSSVNHAEIGEWERKYMQPMVDEVAKLTKDEADYGELVEYMQALHGLERNRVMAFQKAIAKDAEAMSGGESTINEKELWQSYLSDPERSENDQAWAERKISVEEWHKKDDEIRSRYAPSYEEKRKEDYAGLTALAKGESDSLEDIEAEAKMIVRLYEQEQDTSHLWDAVRSATEATLDKQLKSGLLSRAAYDHIRGMYQYYIPLRGFDEKTSEDVYAYVAVPTAGQGIERVAKGRTSRADDPLANIRKMAEQTISRGNRNRLVGQRFLNFVRNHPSDLVSLSPVWVEKDVKGEWVLSTPNIPEDASAEEVMHLQAQHDKDMHELAKLHPEQVKQLKQDITSPYRVLSDKQLSEHQMIVRVGGRDVLITINGNPRVTQALRGLSNPDRKRHAAIEGTKALGRTLGQLYTTYSPQFVLRNWVRDSGFANTFVYAKEGANYGLAFNKNWAANNPIVLRRLLKDYEDGLLSADEDRDRYFIEFMSNGGETGYMIAQDMAKHKEEIQKLIKEARGEGNSLLGLRVLGEEWELLNRSAELATRFAAYMTSRQMGRSVDRAVWDAKEITVNFNTKGAGGKYVGANGQTFMGSAAGSVAEFAQDLIIFFNPAIQGLANLVAAAKRNPKQTAAYIVSMIALGATMALVNGGDGEDDNYFDQSAYKRRHHLFVGADGKYLTLPIPQEIAPFYGLGELMMSIALGKEHGSSFDLGVRALSLLSDFSPIDLGDGVMGVVPSATRPIVDTFVNKDFLGRPIANRTEFNKHAPEYMRVYSRTNPAFVKLSEALNTLTGGDEVSPGWIDTNPAYIEHLVRGYGGGLADLAMTLSDIGKRVVEGDALGARDLPVIKGLYSETDDRMHGRKTNEAYRELLQEVKSTEYRLRSYQSQQRRGVLDAAEKANFLFNSPEMKRLLIFNQWKGILRSLSNQKEQSDSPEDLKFLEAEELRIKRELLKEIGDATK